MKTFIANNVEVAECELVGEGLPITQEGAIEFVKRMDKIMAKANRTAWHNKIDGCYRGKRKGH